MVLTVSYLFFRYLLLKGFNFVLTRHLNGDKIEHLFSMVRQLLGNADQGHAVGSMLALEKILKTGILRSSEAANVPNVNYQQLTELSTLGLPRAVDKQILLDDEDNRLLDLITNCDGM